METCREMRRMRSTGSRRYASPHLPYGGWISFPPPLNTTRMDGSPLPLP